jgi:hypothetical protein
MKEGVKNKLELIGKIADLLADIDPEEAARMFFTAMMILGNDPGEVGKGVKAAKPSKTMN